jgi:uncharacterized protein (TIGR02266 family)
MSDDQRSSTRQPVALRIKLRYSNVEQFISKFALNLSRGGMFLASRNPKPVGTQLFFELRLADDQPVIEGAGEVRWVAGYDREAPDGIHGMGVAFTQLSPASRAVIDKVLELRAARGDVDLDDIPRPAAPTTRLPSQPLTIAPSGPIAVPVAKKPPTTPPPIPAAAARPRPPSAPAPVARAGGARSIESALARARRLADGLEDAGDDALAQLLEDDAVPTATVDQASRELAERLGGNAVDTARFRAPAGSRRPTTVAEAAEDRGAAPRSATVDDALVAIEREGEREVADLRRAKRERDGEALRAIDELKRSSMPRQATEIPIDLDVDDDP